jgi:hypothetical protein
MHRELIEGNNPFFGGVSTMRKTLLVLLAIAFGMTAGSPAFANNLKTATPAVFEGNDLTPDTGGARVLYAPSEADDAAYRAQIAAAAGGTCDYYDARYGTPDAALLSNYDCVHVWANYAFADNVGYGNNLADFVDVGGHVVLGAFCAYTSGNYLSGRVMTDTSRYCPVLGGSNHFAYSDWDGTDATCCVYDGVTAWGALYRDYLTLVGPGATICGHFRDQEMACALNAAQDVIYANGSGGYPIGPYGDMGAVIAAACVCAGGGTAVENSTWGAVKDLYR